MNAVLVYIVGARQPLIVESVLHAAGNMNGVGRFVRRSNHISRRAAAPGQAAGADQRIRTRAPRKAARSDRVVRAVDPLECSRPSVLCQIVIVHAEAGTDYRGPAAADRVSETQAWCELVVVILRQAGHNRNLQCLHGDVRGVVRPGFALKR